jgi:hypothetical protein
MDIAAPAIENVRDCQPATTTSRFLPGDEVGAGRVPPLRASTGRFQAATTGRYFRAPTTRVGRPAGQRKGLAVPSANYRSLLRTPGAAAFFLPASLGRVGVAMTSLSIVWLVHGHTGTFASAGLVGGGFAVAEALGAPQLARLVDRFGQTRVLPPALLAHALAVAVLVSLVVADNFRLDHDGAVVLRTAAASESARAVDGAVVAFEADAVNALAQAGWSVVVTGRAEVVTDEAERQRLEGIGLGSWVPAPEEVFVRIEPELVTGRELLAGRTLYGLHLSA